MQKYILTFLLAAVVGLLGGIQGQAGSLYVLTGLLMLGIVKTQSEAAGTALLYTSVPLTIGAAYEYYRQGKVNLKIAAILIFTAFSFAYLGAKINPMISPKVIEYSIAVMTLLSSIYFFKRAYFDDSKKK
tara:strand:- start:342 stop:731 length:390 start_codon:yes stop_codon:yes gene_type:complete